MSLLGVRLANVRNVSNVTVHPNDHSQLDVNPQLKASVMRMEIIRSLLNITQLLCYISSVIWTFVGTIRSDCIRCHRDCNLLLFDSLHFLPGSRQARSPPLLPLSFHDGDGFEQP
jgi:hypothetical protein